MRRRGGLPIAVGAVLCCMAAALTAQLVSTTTAAAGTGTITSVTPNPAAAGQAVTVAGSGWPALASVALYWDTKSTVLGTGLTNTGGSFAAQGLVPITAANGPHLVLACQTLACAGTTTQFSVQVGTAPTATPAPTPTAAPTATPTPTPTPLPTPSPTAVATPTPAPGATPPGPPLPSVPPLPFPGVLPGLLPPALGLGQSPAPSSSTPASSSPAGGSAPGPSAAAVANFPGQAPGGDGSTGGSPSGPSVIPAVAGAPPTLGAYLPTSDPHGVIELEIAAFVLLGLAGSRPLVLAGSRWWTSLDSRSGWGRDAPASAAAARLTEVRLAAAAALAGRGGGHAAAAVAPPRGQRTGRLDRGDISRTWRWPGTTRFDALSRALPVRLAPRSALLARVVTDGSYLRAIAGSLALVLPVAGLALGVAAAVQTGAQPVPPSLALLIALAVVGVLDAVAGLVGVGVFVLACALGGGLWSAEAIRTLLDLCAIWFAVPLVAGAARPLRRTAAIGLEQRYNRLGDFAIGGLLGAWAVEKMVTALPGFSGIRYAIAGSAGTVALAVLAALAVRLAGETLAAHFYPKRLAQVQPQSIPAPGGRHRLLMTVLRTVIFVFIAAPFVGLDWQLYVGGVLFLVPQVLAVYEARLPVIPLVSRLLPRGILKTVLMLGVGVLFGTLVLDHLHDPQTVIADGFVLLSLPGLVLSIADLVAGEGPEAPQTWWHRGAGVVLLGVGILFALGVIG